MATAYLTGQITHPTVSGSLSLKAGFLSITDPALSYENHQRRP